ncbi:uncharacterized protein LOC133338881 isoform X1 [Musca vetustissima]|uniref:uncharacterized protein LOC133338881 isoform X1 n=1 Tax=Musca vetustissima TaxID=27455 RepID=UPI002AB66688|nr:uncharacterized protein LOC133338881 isoform X1 [Musca vetustissima]
MVAIEHRSKSSNTTTSTSILSPTSNSSVNSATTSVTSTTSLSTKSTTTLTVNKKMSTEPETSSSSKSAVSQRQVEAKVSKKSHKDKDGGGAAVNNQEATKKSLKLDLKGKETDLESLKSPKSPIGGRLTHQTSLSSSVDVEDRKTLREALYQGIFHRHRRTIFAFGSFLRMLRSRNSQYNSIRSASEGEAEVEEVR